MNPFALARHLNLYLDGLDALRAIPAGQRTTEMERITRLLQRETIDFCDDCENCYWHTACPRSRHPVSVSIEETR